MFFKVSTVAICTLAAITNVTSSPLGLKRSNELVLAVRTSPPPPSFNNYGGLDSMSNFDNFYGAGNFDGSQNSQTVITVQETVCHKQTVEIVQQRLLVLQEMAKKIITETVCDVETQTIIFEQHVSSLSGFSHDMRRTSGKQVGYDQSISSHLNNIMDSNGTVTTHNLNFTGTDAGKNTVVPGGNNWNNSTSPASVGAAYNASRNAVKALHNKA